VTATILSIISLLLPLVIDYWQERRKDPYAKKQSFRASVVDGDADAVTARVDKLREAIARRNGGKPNGTN